MLLALLIGWFLTHGGSGEGPWVYNGQTPSAMRKAVAKVEPDKSSRKPIESTLDRIESETKRLQSERGRVEKDVFAALEKHGTTTEQFRALAEQVDRVDAAANRNLLDLRFALRSQLSAAQWRVLFPNFPRRLDNSRAWIEGPLVGYVSKSRSEPRAVFPQ